MDIDDEPPSVDDELPDDPYDPDQPDDPYDPDASDTCDLSSEDEEDMIVSVVALTLQAAEAAAVIYSESLQRTPYHTSILTGQGWVQELRDGHPERIQCELGVRKHVFDTLLDKLGHIGHMESQQGVTLEEQLAIFLYMVMTGLSVWHIGERFQCSNETISR